MLNSVKNADKVWLGEVLKTVGAEDLQVDVATPKGFILNYDPSKFTAHQAQEMMAIAERDNRFEDYGVDVESNTIFFKYF